MDILHEAYTALWELNIVDNHCDFSERWLNKSRRYYSMIRASGRNPSVDALGRLATNIKLRRDICRDSDHPRLRQKTDRLSRLLEQVACELDHRIVEEQPVPGIQHRHYRRTCPFPEVRKTHAEASFSTTLPR